jgi:hypothetical protein
MAGEPEHPIDPFDHHHLNRYLAEQGESKAMTTEQAKLENPSYQQAAAKQYNRDAAEEHLKIHQVTRKAAETVLGFKGTDAASKESQHLPSTNPEHYRDLIPGIAKNVQYYHLVNELLKGIDLDSMEAHLLGTILNYAVRYGRKDAKHREAQKLAWNSMCLVAYLENGNTMPDTLGFDVHARVSNASKVGVAAPEEIMHWDGDDVWQRPSGDIASILANMSSARDLEVGEVVHITRATRLPDVRVRVTNIPKDADVEYEVIPAATEKGQP